MREAIGDELDEEAMHSSVLRADERNRDPKKNFRETLLSSLGA
jgi:hypothetical protein